MKHNTAEVASLDPDYLGFIFYDSSPRNFERTIPPINNKIMKVGVFVDATLEFILEKVSQHQLQIVQLHGNESPDFCDELQRISAVQIWKVFPVGETIDFNSLQPYESLVDLFVFDTKGKQRGGTGRVFNWDLLLTYPSKKPFIISGGVGPKKIHALRSILNSKLPIHAIDLNSKFEIAPGFKDIQQLKRFKDEL